MSINLDTLYKDSTPIIGTPCTICFVTDSHPAKIVEVVSKKTIRVQCLGHKIISGSEFDGTAEYEYFENITNPIYTFTKRKNGSWIRKGEKTKYGIILSIGHARRYYDPHF